MEPPNYRGTPIKSLEGLAQILDYSVATLRQTAKHAARYYRPNAPEHKPDGRIRQTFSVLPPLCELQDRILIGIFHHVEFPTYLQGSIKATGIPRDYIVDASLHAQYRVTISDDIKDFFPSIKHNLVLSIWRDFFGCSPDVARILAQLTTYKGFIPQGASTSSYLANLVFWDTEHKLVSDLMQSGFFYTRYVDDINVSTNTRVTRADIDFVTTEIYGMLAKKRLRPNRKKRDIQTPAHRKTVHNLNINAGVPTMPKEERSKIRAAVKQCEEMARADRSSQVYVELYRSTLGRVSTMQRMHPREAQPYRDRLNAIRPIPAG
jgi:hypothetical protein